MIAFVPIYLCYLYVVNKQRFLTNKNYKKKKLIQILLVYLFSQHLKKCLLVLQIKKLVKHYMKKLQIHKIYMYFLTDPV